MVIRLIDSLLRKKSPNFCAPQPILKQMKPTPNCYPLSSVHSGHRLSPLGVVALPSMLWAKVEMNTSDVQMPPFLPSLPIDDVRVWCDARTYHTSRSVRKINAGLVDRCYVARTLNQLRMSPALNRLREWQAS